MAASANPSGGNQEGNNGVVSNGGGGNPNGGGKSNTTANPDNSATVQALKHSPLPGLAVVWTPKEQTILEESLAKYSSEMPVRRYALIADILTDKTLRDIALRSRWMTKKESGKRRKDDMSRKNKDKKEKTVDPSAKSTPHIAMRPNVPPYAPPMIPMDNDDGISFEAIGGSTGHLLAQNAQVFEQISANFATLQIHENINLFCQTRDNILTIMNELNNDMPGIMKQMPLPVKVNEELANSILPRSSRPMQS